MERLERGEEKELFRFFDPKKRKRKRTLISLAQGGAKGGEREREVSDLTRPKEKKKGGEGKEAPDSRKGKSRGGKEKKPYRLSCWGEPERMGNKKGKRHRGCVTLLSIQAGEERGRER